MKLLSVVRRRRLARLLAATAAVWAFEAPSPAAAQAAVSKESAPSLTDVFREVPLDLWRFVSLDTAMVLTAGGGVAGFAHEWDSDLVTELQVNTQLNDSLAPGSKYGAFAVMLGGSLAVYGIGRAAGQSHLAVVGADLVRGQFVAQLWTQALKFTVRRERPDQSNDLSFPSGHAAGAFAAAGVLARHYGWKAAIPGYLGATYVAASRVHDNKHYLSDVTFGAAIGIAGARTVLLPAGRYGVRVAPSLAPGSVAISATLVPGRP